MKLQELLAGVAVQSRTAAPELEIGEVRYDSRAVERATCSWLSAAMRRMATGISKGARAGRGARSYVKKHRRGRRRSWWRTPPRAGEIAANRFGHPADSMVMLGVTGTNSKTTTTYLIKHILEQAGAYGRADRHQPEPDRKRGHRN